MFQYEELNRIMLERIIQLNRSYLDDLMHRELELDLILVEKFYIENPVIEIKRLYFINDKLLKVKEGIVMAKSQHEKDLIDM